MHSRFLLILILSFLSSQTFYESTIGVDFHSYNARALSIGSSSHILDRTALSLKNNPSNISIGEDFGFSITSSYIGSSGSERRGIIVKDGFEEYLAETDYVKNINYTSSLAIGIKFKRKINNKINFALGISSLPYKSYNYNYKEEVRGSASSDGPTSRDPLLGYHILESNGEQSLSSLGSSISYIADGITISFGLSINSIHSTSVSENVRIDTTTSSEDISGYFSDIIPYDIKYNLAGNNFLTFGNSIQSGRYLFSFSLEHPSIIEKNFKNENDTLHFYFNQSNSTTISYFDLYEDDSIIKEYLNNYFALKFNDIQKPEKYNIGFSIINPEDNSFNFVFNYEYSKYKKSHILSSHKKYSIGIEHYTLRGIPLRFGIEYKTSPFKPYISSISSFTAGSGCKIYSLLFDFGVKYSQIKYDFPDLFPVINDLFHNLDTVNESNLDLIGTLTYKF